MQQKAFFIINNDQIFYISQPITNIGRRLDNQLVIDNPHISRTHAQLKVMGDHYVLIDLKSTSGTFVNGQRIYTTELQPGDVITLADVTMVFGTETPPQKESYTKPFPPRPAGDTPTIFNAPDEDENE
ncbi:MAG: FHA domain-containing protein [Chloroflexota bacterium]